MYPSPVYIHLSAPYCIVCKILTLNSTMFGRAIGWCVVKKEKVLVHPESLPVPQKNREVLLLVLD